MKHGKSLAQVTNHLFKAHPDTLLVDAYTVLRDNWIRHLPVVDENDAVVGVISERDFNRAKISGVGPTVESRLRVRFPVGARVRDFMSDKVYSISVKDDLRRSIDIMLQNKVSSCLVTDGDKLVGIVTTDDLLRLLRTYLNSPIGTLSEQFEAMVKTSPLGVFGYTLSNFGI